VGLVQSAALNNNTPPVTAKQPGVLIPGDQPEEGRDSYWGDFEEREDLRWKWKTLWERSTSGPGSEYDNGEELGDDKIAYFTTSGKKPEK